MSKNDLSYDRLRSIISPPQFPLARVEEGEWQEIENQVGTLLPIDYKLFMESFGGCEFWNYLQINSPAGSVASLLDKHNQTAHFAKRIQSRFGMFPEENGLLLFGSDESGNLYYWRTSSLVAAWTVVVVTPDFLECFELEGTFCDFMVWMITTKMLPEFLAAINFRARTCDVVSPCAT